MGKSDPPAPPDPKETAAAQTGTNISTAIANSTMGMVDQNTPYGQLNNEIIGYETITDGATGTEYQVPRYRQTTTLNDQQQATLDETQAAQFNMGALANERSEFLRDYLPNTGAVTDEIDAKLYDMGSKRLDPRFEREQSDMQTRLANQGITPGSEAWKREMDQFGQTKNDAYNNLALTGRGTAMNEVNAPINQITALLSGSQVSNPNVQGGNPAQSATTDYAGLVGDEYQARLGNWQTKQAQRQSLMGGLFGLASAGIGAM